MTSTDINYLMIFTIIIALAMMATVIRQLKRWIGWALPVIILLLHGLFYSIVYIIDATNGGITTPMVYNLWNNVLRGQTYFTVIAYVAAFKIMTRIVRHG